MVLSKDEVSGVVSAFLRKKAADEAWESRMVHLADFTFDLFEKQHAKYSHLRPMYRTVHRKTPRRLVFRAIRWVNPARMFPKAMLTREQIAALSPEERAEAISEIANYRREAHLIRNRYNEMISLIKEGHLPYYIRYAGVKVQSMEEYMERAQRLKDGTSDWEFELDKKAVEFREEMGKLGESFDDVPDLWKDGVPPFYDPKRGRKKKALIRKIDKDGNRVDAIQVAAGDYILVPSEEIREGEELWVPEKILRGGLAGVPIRIPTEYIDNNWENARNFLENEGQFQTELPDKRKVQIVYGKPDDIQARREGRATQMDPLRHDEEEMERYRERARAGQEQEAERVKGRWGRQRHAEGVPGEPGSHIDAPGAGGDPVAHRGVAKPISQATTDDPREVMRRRRAGGQQIMPMPGPETVKRREERLRQRQEAAQAKGEQKKADVKAAAQKFMDEVDAWPADRGMPKAKPEIAHIANTKLNGYDKENKALGFVAGIGAGAEEEGGNKVDPVQNNEAKQNGADNFLKELGLEGDDLWLYGEQDLENIDPSEVKFMGKMGLGGVNSKWNLKVKIRGKEYVYKLPAGEQLGEKAAYAFDKALGLGIMPHIKIANLGMEPFKEAIINGDMSESDALGIAQFGENGGGFLMEMHPNFKQGHANFSKVENRQKLYGLIALDVMLGNPDRHNGNWGSNGDGELCAVDNGQLGRFNDIEDPNMRQNGMIKWEIHRDSDGTSWEGGSPNKIRAGGFSQVLGDPGAARAEFNTWFDEHFDMDKVLDAAEAMDMFVIGELMDGTKVTTDVIKKRMGDYVLYAAYGNQLKPNWWNGNNYGAINMEASPPEREGGARAITAPISEPAVRGQQPRMPGMTRAGVPTPEEGQPGGVASLPEGAVIGGEAQQRWGADTAEDVAIMRNVFNSDFRAAGAPASMRPEAAEQFIEDNAGDLPSDINVADFVSASMDGRVIRKMYE